MQTRKFNFYHLTNFRCRSVIAAAQFILFSPDVLTVLLRSFQDSELKRTVDESERIKRAYGHYFDLCIVNDGLEAAFRSLRLALDKLSTEQQWVPVSWVFWKSPMGLPARCQGLRVEERRTIKLQRVGAVSMESWVVEGQSVMNQCKWPASCRVFLYKLSVPLLSLMSSCIFICRNLNNLIDIRWKGFRVDYEV